MSDARVPISMRVRFIYVGCYAAWLALTVLASWATWQLYLAVPNVTRQFTLNPWRVDLAEKAGAILLGIAWLIWVLFLEGYLRNAVPTQQLTVRTVKALVFGLLALGLAYALQSL